MADLTWATLGKSSGTGNDTVSVTVSENDTIYSREGFIKAEAQDGSGIVKSIKVIQYGKPSFKIQLYLVGVETGASGGPMIVNSYYCVFTPLIPVTAYDHLIVEASVCQGDDSLISFPEQTGGISSADPTILKFPISLNVGDTSSKCSYVFSQPIHLLGAHGMYFKDIKAYSEPNSRYVFGDKGVSTVYGETENLVVGTSSISKGADGGTYSVTVGTQDSVEWTVE